MADTNENEFGVEDQIVNIKEKCDNINPLVVIQCITYNHGPYIRDALEGFVMQKTDFPFVAIVHDDASTDNTADIVREYAEKYPDIILPIYEKENQYSKKAGSIGQILRTAIKVTGAKYVAMCEGDDYWTSPNKLQLQTDFLELHPDYSLCATNVINESKGKKIPSVWNTMETRDLSIEEIIMNGGLFLATASMMMKRDLLLDMPKESRRLHVGDYPLQIYLAYKGKVKLLVDNTCVYRIGSVGSWSEGMMNNKFNWEKKQDYINKELHLLQVMDELTLYQYHKVFKKRSYLFKFSNSILFSSPLNSLRNIISAPLTIVKHSNMKQILVSLTPVFIKKWYYKK